MKDTMTMVNILGIIYLSAAKYVVTVEAGKNAYKIFQIIFNRGDGSLHVNFPYFIHKEGIVCEATIPGKVSFPYDLSLLPGGKTTKHQVKYSHHVSGETLFSQDGKVFTQIRKKSVPLRSQSGHLFTVLVWGIPSFDLASKTKDQVSNDKRSILTFAFDETPLAIKIVGMWYSTQLLSARYIGGNNFGPKAPLLSPDGRIREGLLLIDPFLDNGKEYALGLYCEKVPSEDTKEALTFIGGFDPPEIIEAQDRDTNLLALLYPAKDVDNVAKKIGSIDFS